MIVLKFLLYCLFDYSLYQFFDIVFNKCFADYKLLTHDKKTYILSNVSKSVVLMIIGLFYYDLIYQIFSYNKNYEWDSIVAMYASTDLVSLVLVKRMERSTILHHLFVNIVASASIYYESYHIASVWRLIIVYGIFSGYAYSVNAFLGLRFLYPRGHSHMRYLAKFSYYIYILCCVINWSIQLACLIEWSDILFVKEEIINLFCYFVAIIIFIIDDIKLLQFLKNYATLKN